uniref:Uncharacterized protein n=1 Tax=Lotus japonicus TaxID=34305 RepID=I3S3C0_LOTJA|nr:unknown [Lotus japonicus]
MMRGFRITLIGQRMVLRMVMVQKHKKFLAKLEEGIFVMRRPRKNVGHIAEDQLIYNPTQ